MTDSARAAAPTLPAGWPEISSLDLAEVLAQSAQAAAQLCRVDSVVVLLLSEAEGELRAAATFPRGRSVAPIPSAADMPSTRALRTQKAAIVEDIESEPDADWSRARQVGTRAILAIPILAGGRTRGVLGLGLRQPHRFDAAEIGLATEVARHLAVSIEKASLYQEATERIAELSLLHEVAIALNEGQEIERILGRAADRLAALVDASACYVLLLDAESGDLVGTAASNGRAEEVKTIRLGPASKSAAVASVREKRPVVVEDARGDSRVNAALVDRFGEKALLALPMMHGGRVIGAIVFDDTRRVRQFNQGEIDRVLTVSSQLAGAVENARLHEDLKRSYAELAMAQAKLVQRERFAALGELAAAVAHEVRNPLGAIFNALGELNRHLGGQGEVGALLSILGEESDRINRIIGDLLDFARPPGLSVDQVSLSVAIEDAAASSARLPGIVFSSEVDDGLDRLRMDQRQMRQALLNVFNNAVQAMGGRGNLRVRGRRVERNGSPAVAIEISDSGPGVPKAVEERIFEPFFTTKASGTGLGLAVVRRIVEGHGGSVEVRAGKPTGAVFTLYLPFAEGAEA
ncbi:MAG TPA: GAF domain-containing protein [Myxococcales bacterium]|nr:GAF domain-containing protein [Myxococcales bacterium]